LGSREEAAVTRAAWVNQGGSYEKAKQGPYLWAGLQSRAGTVLHHHAAVGKLEPEDLLINYALGQIRAVGRVTHPPVHQTLPYQEENVDPDRLGNLVRFEIFELDDPIPLSSIPEDLRIREDGPFDVNGIPKQGYLFFLTRTFVGELRRLFETRWPTGSPILDDEFAPATDFVRLRHLIERFKRDVNYPMPRDEERLKAREEMAAGLTEEALKEPDAAILRRVAGPAFGSPGPMPEFNRQLSSGPEAVARVGNSLAHLAYGSEDLAARFDEVLDAEEYAVAGMKEGLLTKVLAILYPEEWLLAFVSRGRFGKREMIRLLELEPPDDTLSAGGMALETNRILRLALTPFFGQDTYLMSRFLFWVIEVAGAPPPPKGQEGTLETLADTLLFPAEYLQRIERLLQDKKQVIFYGPPGTGKTFVARELASYYSKRPEAMEKVQFHPSYTYEDFVEGFRPRLRDGSPGFDLVDGPLKRLAQAALGSPEHTHVLLIDEINRGNVAKVFGELYYLLEYRDEELSLLYSETKFALPQNLWVIGTMNTADRSIALVDSALRRRFHFVPFFPDEPPVQGLLRRWLKRHRPELVWVADVMDRANVRLGDRHQAIGPSHFMREDLDEDWVVLIWEHSVLPYIAEQFFGEEARLAEFDLGVLRQVGPPQALSEQPTAESDVEAPEPDATSS